MPPISDYSPEWDDEDERLLDEQVPSVSSTPESLLELKKYWLLRAVNLLVRREHSEYEFVQKLKLKACPAEFIEGILSYCKAQNYLNETRFAEAFAQSKANKGFGPKRVRYELQQHRLKEADIAIALEETDWQAAKEIALRKCAGKEAQKLRNALFQRGFSDK